MKIGLLGCGTVGSGVVEIIEKLKGSLEIQHILVKSPEDCKDARYTCNYADLVNAVSYTHLFLTASMIFLPLHVPYALGSMSAILIS